MSITERTGARATKDYEAALDDIANRGVAAIRDTKAGLDDAVTNVADRGEEALRKARDVRDDVADIVAKAIRERPYTTLAIAGLFGFAYGALRRR
jgi:ElaB/YqjD/DUF883 family membrane-anchored ribosome-binding protein